MPVPTPAGAANAGGKFKTVKTVNSQVTLELGEEKERADGKPPIGVIALDDTYVGVGSKLFSAFKPKTPIQENKAAHVDVEFSGGSCWSMPTPHFYANFFFIKELFVATKVSRVEGSKPQCCPVTHLMTGLDCACLSLPLTPSHSTRLR